MAGAYSGKQAQAGRKLAAASDGSRRNGWRWLPLVALLVLGAGCARTATDLPTARPGVASWYGPGFHGRRTATGERYDQLQLTAAHRSWPLGTRVRVTHAETGRNVVVRINDRGPFVAGRDIDLSLGAARALGMVNAGTAEVRLEPILRPGEALQRVAFAVQVAAYRDLELARAASDDLQSFSGTSALPLRGLQLRPYVARTERDGAPLYRVRIGPCPERSEALMIASALRTAGHRPLVVEENLPAL